MKIYVIVPSFKYENFDTPLSAHYSEEAAYAEIERIEALDARYNEWAGSLDYNSEEGHNEYYHSPPEWTKEAPLGYEYLVEEIELKETPL